jgi:hypothetical protein
VRAIPQLGLAALVLTAQASLGGFMLAGAATGTASAFFQPASTGIVPEAVSADRLQQGLTRFPPDVSVDVVRPDSTAR